MPEFKFSVGDILRLKASPDFRFQILARLAEECSGGVQLHYAGRIHVPRESKAWSVDKDAPLQHEPSMKTERLHEIELELIPTA